VLYYNQEALNGEEEGRRCLVKLFRRLVNLIVGKQEVALVGTSSSQKILDDFFPNMGELQQKLAEVGLGPLLPTLAGVSGKRTAEQFIQVGNPDHRHKFSEVRWDSEKLGPCVTDMEGRHYVTFKNFFGCSCGALKITSERAFI